MEAQAKHALCWMIMFPQPVKAVASMTRLAVRKLYRASNNSAK